MDSEVSKDQGPEDYNEDEKATSMQMRHEGPPLTREKEF